MKRLFTVLVVAALLMTSAAPAFADTAYVVQPGDTLARIAARFGVSVSAIISANGITNPNLILVGQRLVIPGVDSGSGSGSGAGTGTGGTYVVQRGDTLSRIAARFGVSLSALMSANGITNPNLILVGQRLVIPGTGAGPSPAPTSAPTTAPPTATPSAPSGGTTYVVQRGDTLWGIARRFNTTIAAIQAANGLTSSVIFVGQRLVIPGPGGATPAPTPGPTATAVPTTVPPPSGSGGFELGGQVSDFSAPDRMKHAGMVWVKRQVRWHPGAAANADTINDAHAKGFKILLSVLGEPGDISGGANFDSYAAFVGDLAALGADAIEVWNEMNIDREWPRGQINPATYTDLLRRSYNAIKSRNPNTLVISGAPAPTGAEGAFGLDRVWNDDRYIRGLAAAGAASYLDCIGVHYNEGIISPTRTTGDPRDNYFTRYYQGMVSTYFNAFGGARRLCFTELGYLSPEGYGPLPPAFGWAGDTSVAEHAQWLGEAANLAKNSGIVRMLIVFNVDFKVYGDDPQAGYAIVRSDGSCPACDTLRAVTGGR
jgi:LysM repeat protein